MTVIVLIVLTVFALAFLLWVACYAGPPDLLGHRTGWRRSSWREAEERAEALVQQLLSDDEYRQLRRYGYLEIASPSLPFRTYRVPRNKGQVGVFEDGVLTMKLCIQSVEPIPDGDTIVMHKLMIEGNEREYLRIANRFPPTFNGMRRGTALW